MTLSLRPLQIEFVNQMYAALRENRRVCGVAPCGFGKRFVLTYWADEIAKRNKRLLVITNRRILIEQLAQECRDNKIDFGIIMADTPTKSSSQVQIASAQTLKIRKFKNLPPADWIAIDEAHNELSAYKKIFDLYPNAKCVGVTATPVGPSGMSLIGVYDKIVEPVNNQQLIEGGWLLRTRCFAPSEPDLQGVWIDKDGTKRKGVDVLGGKEFSQRQLAQVVENCHVASDVFKYWLPFSDMQTLCITPRVKYAYGIAEQFEQRGFKAAVIEGGTNQKERQRILDEYKDKKIRVIVGVDVPKEGLDLPIAQVGIDLQPCFQFRNWWQKLGRCRRTHEGQKEAIWLDFAGNLWRHGIHPDNSPSWADVTDGKTIQDVLAEKTGRRCKECGSTRIERGLCLDCGSEVGPVKPPWTCSNCHYTLSIFERLVNGTCPNCGQKVGKSVRRIRMASGEMRIVAADELKSRKKSTATDAEKAWQKARYQAYYSGKTLSFARWLYQQSTGNWPDPKILKNCPPRESGDWARKISDVQPWMSSRAKNRSQSD